MRKTCPVIIKARVCLALLFAFVLSLTYVAKNRVITLPTIYETNGRCNATYPPALSCNCERSKTPILITDQLSTCDYFSSAREKHGKVASYAFYGNTSSIYFRGVEPSIINVAKFYPGWVMRLYHNINTSDPAESFTVCELWCKYPHLDMCDVRNLPFPLCDKSDIFGMLWRFLPLGDPFVERFIVRDLDGPILQRETDAVKDWIRRNKTFHIMRDHPYHGVSMLGGMWGAENRNRSLMEHLRRELISDGKTWQRGEDQNLLQKIVWPFAVNDSVAHDSYVCQHFPNTIPFPTRRVNLSYVGMIYEWRVTYELPHPCPKECRPREHQDWEYC